MLDLAQSQVAVARDIRGRSQRARIRRLFQREALGLLPRPVVAHPGRVVVAAAFDAGLAPLGSSLRPADGPDVRLFGPCRLLLACEAERS